jgi:hypothetical protein
MELRSVEAIVRALNDTGVQYLIVGGLAVNVHGFARLTRVVDLVIGLDPPNIISGLRVLQKIGYEMAIPITPERFAERSLRERWRAEKSMVVLKLWSDGHRRTPIDVFIYEPFDFAVEYARASREIVAAEAAAPVLAYDTQTRGRPAERSARC